MTVAEAEENFSALEIAQWKAFFKIDQANAKAGTKKATNEFLPTG